MVLWSVQPQEVYEILVKTGSYKCDAEKMDIPDDEVVLSGFDAWHCVLNDYPMLDGDNEGEWEVRENEYDVLPEEEQARIKVKSWEKIFDIEYFDNCWDRRGYEIQATFWELKKEQVRNVRFFDGAAKKR